jgi:hypothetical protein
VTDRGFAQAARHVDRLTQAKVAEKGSVAAAFNSDRVPEA